MQYTEIINTITTNDAAIEAVAVGITLTRWFRGACHDAIDSGAIVRQWWENHGKVYATMAALIMVLVLCALTAVGLIVWRWVRDYGFPGAKAAWEFVNAVTDDGLGLYGPSPMLREWLGSGQDLPSSIKIADVAELDLSKGQELIDWAKERYATQA